MKHPLKILHVAGWYPTCKQPFGALWIRRHLDALEKQGVRQKIHHLDASPTANDARFGKEQYGNFSWRLRWMKMPWKLAEMMAGFMVLFTVCIRAHRYDVINFHIAYPNLTKVHWWKRWVKKPLVITEHWSAYHLNFGIEDPTKLAPIKRIFQQNIPVIAVSRALSDDIYSFSGGASYPRYVVPNVVDDVFFLPVNPDLKEKYLLAINKWAYPKEPIVLLEAWARIQSSFPGCQFRIGGYGAQWCDIEDQVVKLGIADSVSLLGPLQPEEMAEQMNGATLFLQASAYETFSVVCAEALAVGCPVVASEVGGIREFVQDEHGVLVSENSVQSWCENIKVAMDKNWDREKIQQHAWRLFSEEKVGSLYVEVLQEILKNESD